MILPLPRGLRALAAGLLAGLLAAGHAMATQYPLTVTDEAGRQVTIPARPARIALQDGRDIALLALLDRDDPFGRLAVWNNIPGREDPAMWAALRRAWPPSAAIPDMGAGDDGQVDAERLLAARPQLVIAQHHAFAALTAAGVVRRLDTLHIPLLVIDSVDDPIGGVQRSTALLGQALDRELEARDYTDFYAEHLNQLHAAIDAIPDAERPRIFVEVLAGRQGAGPCCFTDGDIGWGRLVAAIGARNIGTRLLGARPAGAVTLEAVTARRPDIYVMTGSARASAGNAMAPFGYGGDAGGIATALARLEARPGFDDIQAVRDGHVFGIWHALDSHGFNIVGLEYLAKFAYPERFADLDPAATWREIVTGFTHLPDSDVLMAAPAPATR